MTEETITPNNMDAEEIIAKLKALKRYEITKYKSNMSGEILEYERCQDYGRFVLSTDIDKLIKDMMEL